MHVQSNWWESFFEGWVVSMWLQAMPPEVTEAEADNLARLLAVPAGAEILDVPCGGGRLTLPMAARGFRMTGVDLSSGFLAHAVSRDAAAAVSWEQRDMRDLPWPGRFDGAFCVGNSFGYLDDEGNAAFLRAVRAALKPGARFILETPMVIENLLGHLQPRPWWKTGDVHLLVENHYDHTRAASRSTTARSLAAWSRRGAVRIARSVIANSPRSSRRQDSPSRPPSRGRATRTR